MKLTKLPAYKPKFDLQINLLTYLCGCGITTLKELQKSCGYISLNCVEYLRDADMVYELGEFETGISLQITREGRHWLDAMQQNQKEPPEMMPRPISKGRFRKRGSGQ